MVHSVGDDVHDDFEEDVNSVHKAVLRDAPEHKSVDDPFIPTGQQ